MGQSILSSELLPPAVTRQWLKPVTFTSRAVGAVGMPWEIYRVADLTDHLFDLYSKSGSLYTYASYLVLSPDYNVGFAALVAGNETDSTVEQLADTVTAELFPAVGKATRELADAKYAGTYTSTDDTLNSTLTISTQEGEPGLVVSGWISNGTSMDVSLAKILGAEAGVDVRLYPTRLVADLSSTKRVGYWAIFEDLGSEPDGGVFDMSCATWISGLGTYGSVDISEFAFEVEDGEVVSIEPRTFRAVLAKDGH